jgi:hypothetical protein
VVVVVAAGCVAAGGGAGGGVCDFVVRGAAALVLEEAAELLGSALDAVGVLVFGVLLTQVDAGVRLSGSSSEPPPITSPTSTPSSADPSTAEPDAAQSARTAILLTGPGGGEITLSWTIPVARKLYIAHLDALSVAWAHWLSDRRH